MGKKKRHQKDWDYRPGKYYVKGIIDYRNHNGTEEYLVWWEGYGEDEATWEPKYNIANASKDSEWQQALRDCQEKAERTNQTYPVKTKLIKRTPEKATIASTKTEQQNKLDTACTKLAEFLLRQKDNLNYFSVGSIQQQEQPGVKNRSVIQHQQVNRAQPLSQYRYSCKNSEAQHFELAHGQQRKRTTSEVRQSKPWSLQDLPVEGIKKRYRIREDQYYYQVDMSKRKELYPILLHQNYIKRYWNDHLQRFNASISPECVE